MKILELIKSKHTPSKDRDKDSYKEIDKIIDSVIKYSPDSELHIAGNNFKVKLINTYDYKGGKTLLINPLENYENIYNHLKTTKNITIYTSVDNHILKFESTGIGELKGKQGFLIEYPFDITPGQRRSFFRVKPSKHKPIKLSFKFKNKTYNIDTIDDISGGGVSFFMHTEECGLRRRDIIADMTINLYNMDISIYRSIVINIMRDDKRTKYTVQFKAIDDHVREQIINYVIEKQREYMKKGYF